MTLSNKARKKQRKQRMCLNKRTFNTIKAAKQDSDLRVYRCPFCYRWHRTNTIDMSEVDEVMKKYK